MPKNSQFDPPALPPKKQRNSSSNASLNVAVTPPVSPKITNEHNFAQDKNEEKAQTRNSFKLNSNDVQLRYNSNKNENAEQDTVVLRKKPTETVRHRDKVVANLQSDLFSLAA